MFKKYFKVNAGGVWGFGGVSSAIGWLIDSFLRNFRNVRINGSWTADKNELVSSITLCGYFSCKL